MRNIIILQGIYNQHHETDNNEEAKETKKETEEMTTLDSQS